MKQKTYGVMGYMEWHGLLRVGQATVHVPFTGGNLSSCGVTPAEYTTSKAAVQKVIEQSEQFKDGMITILRETELDDEPEVKSDMKQVEVTDLDSAQSYLMERYKVSRTQIRNISLCNDFATSKGIEFIWNKD